MRIAEVINLLAEDRRNPQLNPRVDPLSAFSMYKNKPNMFITYTDLPKIGVNPRSQWDTPFGIYSYPLDYVLELAYREGTIYGVVPFAGESKYVQLFQQTGNMVDVEDRLGYHDVDLTSEYIADILNDEMFLYDVEQINFNRPETVGQLWKWVYGILKARNTPKQSIYTRKLFHDILGYDAITDMRGRGIIHMSEPVQAVHFTTRTIKPIEIFENKSKHRTSEVPYFMKLITIGYDALTRIQDFGTYRYEIGRLLNEILDGYFEDQDAVNKELGIISVNPRELDYLLKNVEETIGAIGVIITALSKAERIPGVNLAFTRAHSTVWAGLEDPTKSWGRVVAIYAEVLDPNIYKVFQGIGETFFANPNNIDWDAIRNAKNIFDRNFSPEMVKRMSDRVRGEIL